MATSRLCSIPGCDKPFKGRGLCEMHLVRLRRHGDPLVKGPAPRARRVCSVEGCAGLHQAKGYCEPHYRKYLKYGSPHASAPAFQRQECLVDQCSDLAECRGYCKAHYARLVRHGDPLAGRRPHFSDTQWLIDRVDYIGDDCLTWPFKMRPNGYGEIRQTDGTRMAASRYMCVLVNGGPPDPSYQAAHSCGNGHLGCVNPRHLRWATRLENEADKRIHGTLMLGEDHPASKLTESDVRQIRALQGTMTHAGIASLFGIARSTVGLIVNRKNWAWLE